MWVDVKRKQCRAKIREPKPNAILPMYEGIYLNSISTITSDDFKAVEVITHSNCTYYAIPGVHYVIMSESGKEYPIPIKKFNEEYEMLL